MKNVQIIDGANNATFNVFQATDEEYAAIFPNGCDMELSEDLIVRLGEEEAGRVLTPLWSRPILKCDTMGIHGTLFYDNERRSIPLSKREVDWDDHSINQAQRELFSRQRERPLSTTYRHSGGGSRFDLPESRPPVSAGEAAGRLAPVADIRLQTYSASSSRSTSLSEDARNSLYLWAGGLAFVGLFWTALHFDWLKDMADKWLWPLVGTVAVINLAQTGWGLWKRRASNPNNPNRNGS